MTKEIIIDGVDVAECEFYIADDKHFCDLSFINKEELRNCDNINDCYYKQLKRLEQENKELKKANEISIEKVTVTAEAKRLQELEQENKDLKKQIESDKGLITVGGKQQDEYLQRIDELEQENKELKEWKERVVKLFESACRCKYLNEETDICSYTNEKCININKCVYKYQELSSNYRSALEEIREIVISAFVKQRPYKEDFAEIENVVNKILNKG